MKFRLKNPYWRTPNDDLTMNICSEWITIDRGGEILFVSDTMYLSDWKFTTDYKEINYTIQEIIDSADRWEMFLINL